MLVKMRTEISGLRDGIPWPLVGGTIDLPRDEALAMLENGSVEPVYDPKGDIERAVLPLNAELRDVIAEPTGLDTSARDALVPGSGTRRTRERHRG